MAESEPERGTRGDCRARRCRDRQRVGDAGLAQREVGGTTGSARVRRGAERGHGLRRDGEVDHELAVHVRTRVGVRVEDRRVGALDVAHVGRATEAQVTGAQRAEAEGARFERAVAGPLHGELGERPARHHEARSSAGHTGGRVDRLRPTDVVGVVLRRQRGRLDPVERPLELTTLTVTPDCDVSASAKVVERRGPGHECFAVFVAVAAPAGDTPTALNAAVAAATQTTATMPRYR